MTPDKLAKFKEAIETLVAAAERNEASTAPLGVVGEIVDAPFYSEQMLGLQNPEPEPVQLPARPDRDRQSAVARLNFDRNADAELDSNWRVDIDRLAGSRNRHD